MTPISGARWRKAAWPLGILAAAVLAVGACEWAGWPFLKGPIESRLGQRLHREVRFGDEFALKLLGSIRVKTDSLRIGAPQGPQADPALGGDLINAQGAWLDLPYGTVRRMMNPDGANEPVFIRSLRFDRVDASLKRLADGRANWIFTPAARRDPPSAPLAVPHFGELVIANGRIALDDALSKTALTATVSTTEGERAAGGKPAGLVIDGSGRHEGRPVEFRVTASGVLPLVARSDSKPVPMTVRVAGPDAKFAFEGTATDVFSLQALDGNATLSGISLARVGDAIGVTLPTTEPFTLKGRLGKSGQVWSLANINLNVGDSRLGGEFSYDRRPQVPLLRGELTGERLVLSDLLPAFGAAPSQARVNPRPPAGRVLPQREFDIPSLHAMNAEVKVRLGRADLGSLFRQPLAPLQGDLTLNGGMLKLSNLLARSAGGELRGGISMDGKPLPLWDIDLRWAGVELEQWLRPRDAAAKQPQTSGQKPGYISGRLGGHAKLQGRGKSTAQLIGSLSGTVQAWIRNGTISHLVIEGAGIDVAEALGVLIRGDERLPLNCAAVRAKAGDGIVVPEVGLVDTGDSTVFVTGSLSLADEKLDLTLVTKPKDTSPLTLRSPVKVEGTFSQPHVRLDSKQLATKVGLAAVLAAVHPLASLIALFDPGEKEHAGGCEQTLQKLRDADGPAGARDAKAPKPAEAGGRQAAAPAPAPVRK
ncbi:AsmA family protein [Piscinibacter sp. XHJ-5]|uniref:AsmA family protein n=1 Tax=Piscinibacter sp. XHJ-5 TaxID=3037797 RepID=UPI002452FAEC|nr:AsmA family protein [Piscinibacter sp. XHJ-5]